jgi:hypothetical protein
VVSTSEYSAPRCARSASSVLLLAIVDGADRKSFLPERDPYPAERTLGPDPIPSCPAAAAGLEHPPCNIPYRRRIHRRHVGRTTHARAELGRRPNKPPEKVVRVADQLVNDISRADNHPPSPARSQTHSATYLLAVSPFAPANAAASPSSSVGLSLAGHGCELGGQGRELEESEEGVHVGAEQGRVWPCPVYKRAAANDEACFAYICEICVTEPEARDPDVRTLKCLSVGDFERGSKGCSGMGERLFGHVPCQILSSSVIRLISND